MRTFFNSASLLLFFLHFFLVKGLAQKKGPDTIRFATYTYATNNRLGNLRPLTDHLSKITGHTIVAISYPTVQRLVEAIVNDSVDIAMMNTSGYLVLQRRNPGIILPLVSLEMNKDAVTNYGGCLVASIESGITTISQLKKETRKLSLALVSSSSTSGNLVPRLLLNKEGVRNAEEKLDVYYAGTHRQALQDVLTGKASLAGCGCAEIDSARAKKEFDGKAVVVAAYNNTPLGPVVYTKKLNKDIVTGIRDELIRIHQYRQTVFENFCAGWTEFKMASRFKPVSDADYDTFRKLFTDNNDLWKLIE
jgi:phosphate/phosphite/phosphonate ABC transporter binding protein